MRINTIAFAGIPVTDIERACDFHEGVLGLKVAEEMMDGKWIEYAVGDHTLAIANVGDQWRPSDQRTTAALEVENFEPTIQTLQIKSSDSPLSHLQRGVVTWPWCRIPRETS